MENVIKAFLGIFFTVIIVFLGVTFISSSIDSRKAETFLEQSTAKIQYSEFAPTVIDSLKSEAAENKYELKVDTYGKGSNKHGIAELKYTITNPILNFTKESVVTADIN